MDRPLHFNDRYVNREFSWLQFNRRVLAEAERSDNPLLERLKFLAIFESNLDEFFMVRVSGLMEQQESGVDERSPEGLLPAQQVQMAVSTARPMRLLAGRIWHKQLLPELARAGVKLRPFRRLSARARARLGQYFEQEVFPLCTPLLIQPGMPFPFLSNRSLNLLVELRDEGQPSLARVKVPPILRRVVAVPDAPGQFVLLEDLIECHLDRLFPGVEVVAAHRFRVVRDADIEIKQLEAFDLISAVEQTLRLRRFGDPVHLEVGAGMPSHVLEILLHGLVLERDDVTEVPGLIGLDAAMALAGIDRPDLKFRPHAPFLHERLASSDGIFEALREGDVLVHHPYDSFRSVEAFVASAATDPAVVGLKQSLYRAGTHSPLVESMSDAAEQGKQVAVMVELKARFDESNNLVWSKALERSGAHVTYGFAELKTHCKICHLVRREEGSIQSYAHIGTGNYNPQTARLYTDLGLFTSDPEICQDVAELFNLLTGLVKNPTYRKLLVAPHGLREGIVGRIRRELDRFRETGRGGLAFKLNSLVDPEVIDALYDASQAGVPIDLNVRGICCLRPGVPGLSETIRVVSLVGRFLEHGRIYYFENGGEPEALLGSADLMRRNLDRRVEALVPVQSPELVRYLREEVLSVPFRDNTNAWVCGADGTWSRRLPAPGEARFCAQEHLMANPATKVLLAGR